MPMTSYARYAARMIQRTSWLTPVFDFHVSARRVVCPTQQINFGNQQIILWAVNESLGCLQGNLSMRGALWSLTGFRRTTWSEVNNPCDFRSAQLRDTQSAQSSLTGKLSKEADPSPAHVRSCIHGSSAEKALPQWVRSPFQHFGGDRSVKMLRGSKI